VAGYPELRETFPKTGETDVLTSRSIILDFSEDMAAAQFQDSNQLSSFMVLLDESTNTPITISYSDYTTRQRRLTLTASLQPNRSYRLIVKKGIRSSFGRATLNDYTIFFSTAASPVSSVSLLNPSDSISLEAEPFVFNWTQATSTGSVLYDVNFYENSSLAGTFTTAATGLSLVSASYLGVLGTLTGRRLTWDVTARVPSGTGFVYAAPSSRRSIYFGAYEEEPDITSARTYIHPSQTVPLQFSVEDFTPENLATNLTTFPTVELIFTEAPATGTMLNYISFTKKDQLPRNDVGSSYSTGAVSGSWVLSGRTLTFVPTENIAFNTRYEVSLAKGMRSVSGQRLAQATSFQFCSMYNPYYVDIRAVKATLRSESATMSDDFINYHIFIASLEAKARYYSWIYGIPDAVMFGDMLQEVWVRDSNNLKSFGALKWTEACTLYNIYNSILVDELRNVGRSRSLADYKESLSKDFIDAIELAKKDAKEEMDYWDNYINNDGVPGFGTRQYNYDRHLNNRDSSIPPSIRRRDDGL